MKILHQATQVHRQTKKHSRSFAPKMDISHINLVEGELLRIDGKGRLPRMTAGHSSKQKQELAGKKECYEYLGFAKNTGKNESKITTHPQIGLLGKNFLKK